MVTSQRGATRAASAATVSGLDARVLALASLAAVLGWIVGHAFGGDLVATLVCAAVMPWITTFLTHPGPHRVRRVAAVLAFSALVASCRRAAAALAAAGPERREPGGRVLARGEALRGGAAAGREAVSAGARQLTRDWLLHVTLTAAVSLVPAAAFLAVREAIRAPAVAALEPTVRVPDDVIAHAGDQPSIRVSYNVTAADNVGNPLVPACRPSSGALFKRGTTRVLCSATDAVGNRADARFHVTVRGGGTPQPPDHKQPALTVPDDFRHEAPTPRGARVTYAASARDARDGALTPDCLPVSGSLFAPGRTRVTCAATDSAGNTARAHFTVTVVRAVAADHTPPDITVPGAIRIRATSSAGAKVAYAVSAVDERDGSLKATCDPPSGSVVAVGSTTVSCSAQDAAGNRAVERFTITVSRAEPPPASDRTPPDISVPSPIQTPATSSDGAKVSFAVSAVDNRDGPVEVGCNPPSGSVFGRGTTTVTCTARDRAGNTAARKFAVSVVGGSAPPPTTTATALDITATASAVRDSYDGACPPPADAVPHFKGVIAVSRGPVTVRYQWLSSNGGSADPDIKEIAFGGSGPQARTVYFTQRVWPSDSGGSLTDWIALYVRAPSDARSNRVSYTVTCTSPGPP